MKLRQNRDFNTFNTLPPEVQFKIFDDLPLSKVVKLQINKQLQSLVNQYLARELQIKELACGQFHSLILLERGRVFAMGANKQGQLGLPEKADQFTPTEITNSERIEHISAGFNHSVMLSKEKEIWVMGNNNHKQLSLAGATAENLELQKILTPVPVENIITDNFTTAYIDNNQVVHSYGSSKLQPHIIKGQLKLLSEKFEIPDHLDIADISLGQEHALLLTSQKEVYGIGSDEYGFLGLGKKAYYQDWTKLPIAQAIQIQATALGSLILTTAHELMASGINNQKQFFANAKAEELSFHFAPIAVNVIHFAANDFHTLYVDTNNQLHALGSNSEGQLGLGKSTAQGKSLPAGLILAKRPKDAAKPQLEPNYLKFLKSNPINQQNKATELEEEGESKDWEWDESELSSNLSTKPPCPC